MYDVSTAFIHFTMQTSARTNGLPLYTFSLAPGLMYLHSFKGQESRCHLPKLLHCRL